MQTTLLAVFVAYVSQFLVSRVYGWKSESDTMVAILEQHLEHEGLIIWKEEKKQIIFANG